MVFTEPYKTGERNFTVAEGGNEGVVIKEDGTKGEENKELPPTAASAEPRRPSFEFENVDSMPVR
jgi:leucyl-tRNA synthetase